MKRKQLKLYFIALVPNEPAYGEIMALKTEIRDKYDSKAALRSPPHITLHMPFQWQEEKEARLISSLDAMASVQQGFEVQLKGFGAFPPRVIFINVPENETLNALQHSIQKIARLEWSVYPKSNNVRPFKPHITIGFRDLKKPQFIEAWNEFDQRSYNATITIANICLLKHNGNSWDILHKAPLG